MPNIDPPYSLDFFQTIVDVHFGGLAVEFFGPGDYEELINGLPNAIKLTLPIWFRIPKATLAAAYEAKTITPILMGGDNTVVGYGYSNVTSSSGSYQIEEWVSLFDPEHPETQNWFVRLDSEGNPDVSTANTFIDTPTRGPDIPLRSSWIGIDGNRSSVESYDPEDGGLPPKKNILVISIQMADVGTGSGVFNYRTSETVSGDQIRWAGGIVDPTPHGDARGVHTTSTYGPDVFGNSTIYITDVNPFVTTTTYEDATAAFLRGNGESFNITLHGVEITGDHWHFLKLTLDLSGSIDATGYQLSSPLADPDDEPDHGSISSSCNAYVTLDGKEYKGAAMRDPNIFDKRVTDRLTLTDHGLYTPNSLITALTRVAANGTTGVLAGDGYTFEQITEGLTKPTYSYGPSGIPLAGFPFGIPATTEHSDEVRDIQLAELQVFNVAERNNGLFLSNNGKPVPPNVASKAIGQKPALLLHTSTNWIKGKNTGDGDDLETHGRIKKYKPDPSLFGPQSPADLRRR